MGFEFRLRIDQIPGKHVSQHYFGLRSREGHVAELVKVIEAWLPEPWANSMCNPLEGMIERRSTDEWYIADLGVWPGGLGEYGIERLRAELIAAGIADASGAA